MRERADEYVRTAFISDTIRDGTTNLTSRCVGMSSIYVAVLICFDWQKFSCCDSSYNHTGTLV